MNATWAQPVVQPLVHPVALPAAQPESHQQQLITLAPAMVAPKYLAREYARHSTTHDATTKHKHDDGRGGGSDTVLLVGGGRQNTFHVKRRCVECGRHSIK